MTIERELLKEVLEYFDPLGLNTEHCEDLPERIKELLAQPEEGVYQKLLRIEKENYVEMLPSELWLDGYEAGKRSALLSKQPESNEPVAWIIETEIYGKLSEWVCTDKKHYMEEHDGTKDPIPLYLAPPKQPESTAEAVMPNGVCVSNVYDAYEEGRKSVMSEQEPVAWCQLVDGKVQDLLTSFEMKDWLYDKSWIPLYTAPPKREPLSDKEITKNTPKLIHIGERLAFHAGVRFAEKHHGIGEEDEHY